MSFRTQRKWSTYDHDAYSSHSSSPPCSSSPPTSPMSTAYSRPHIASSSPPRAHDLGHRLPPACYSPLRAKSDNLSPSPCKLPSFRTMFGDLAPSASSDVELSDSAGFDWEPKSAPPVSLDSVFYSDSEEEDEQDDERDGGPSNLDFRATFFQTSDERGQWKEPLPPSTCAFRSRYSEPTTTRPIPPSAPRTTSEPAQHAATLDFIPESRATSYDADLESENLTSDGGMLSSPDARPFFSLPPSSPPLSPKSLPVSPDLGPLSALSSPSVHYESMPSSPAIPHLDLTPMSPAIMPLASESSDMDPLNLDATPMTDPEIVATPVAVDISEAPEPPLPITCDIKSADVVNDAEPTVVVPSPGSSSSSDHVEPLTTTVQTDGDIEMAGSQSTVLTVKENDAKRRTSEEPAPRKKARTAGPSKPRARKTKDADENLDLAPKRRGRKPAAPPKPAPAPRRRKRQLSVSSSSSSDSEPDEDEPPAPPIPKLAMPSEDLEICGMIIETMATSRASSLSASSLYKMVMTNRPALKRDWSSEVFVRVLQEAHGQNGIFGKVESSGMDDSDRPLEAQWFYVPERDEDQDRATLIRSMMPRPAKRSETKKYKQYYYRPLGKISRWDDEDAL